MSDSRIYRAASCPARPLTDPHDIPSETPRPIVRVLVTGRWSNQAYCGCGWFQKERLFAFRAVGDAFGHSADTGYMPDDLLIEYIQCREL